MGMKATKKLAWLGGMAAVALFGSSPAFARVSLTGGYTQLSGSAATGFNGTAPTLGIEVTETTSKIFEPGTFFQTTLASQTGGASGPIVYLGAMARVQAVKVLGFFLEARVGATLGMSAAQSDLAPGYGAAAGFRFRVGNKLMIGPRVSVDRLVSEHGTTPSPYWNGVNYGLILTFGQTKK
jgi:hypothetical protein